MGSVTLLLNFHLTFNWHHSRIHQPFSYNSQSHSTTSNVIIFLSFHLQLFSIIILIASNISLLMTCPNNLSQYFLIWSNIKATSILPIMYSFSYVSFLVTSCIHLDIFISTKLIFCTTNSINERLKRKYGE